MESIVTWIAEHWEHVTISVLAIDKAVAISPIKYDDLIWTGLKAAFKAIAGTRGK